MAELLLRQGHRDEALGVYDRLLAQRPDDADLRGRVAALREQPAPASTAGAFFAALAATPAEPTDAADAAIVDAREPEPEGEVPDGGPLAGAVSTADALAADRLASGFDAVDDGPSTLLAALDARAAASPPPAPPPGAVETPYAMAEFSFERFFEGLEEPSDASDEPPEPAVADAWAFGDVPRGEVRTPTPASGATAVHPAPPPPEPAEDDDLAQFNAWLKGLIQP
jgi:hypothetical protein